MLTSNHELVQSFMPCEKAAIRQPYAELFSYNYEKCAHKILEKCKVIRMPYSIPYCTCITYKEDVDCEQTHIHDIIPVVIGSKLDMEIYSLIYGKEEMESEAVQKVMYDLYGIIFIVSPLYFSNIFTNRKEMIHATHEQDKQWRTLYVYDVHGRGHRFSIVADQNTDHCIYRNCNGQQRVIDDSNEFREFINKEQFVLEHRHLNYRRMYESFNRRLETPHIDSLSNKSIMSMINILQKAIQLARRNPNHVVKLLKSGSLDKFASSNIDFESTRAKQTNEKSKVLLDKTCIMPSQSYANLNARILKYKDSQNEIKSEILTKTLPQTTDDADKTKLNAVATKKLETVNKSTTSSRKVEMRVKNKKCTAKRKCNDVDNNNNPPSKIKKQEKRAIFSVPLTPAGHTKKRKRPLTPAGHTEKSVQTNKKNVNKSHQSKNKSKYFNTSARLCQNYRIVAPNQLQHNSGIYDKYIRRPIPANVSDIPIETEFFICMADKQMNVDAPHKWLKLLPLVYISNNILFKEFHLAANINELLDILLAFKYIVPSDKLSTDDVMILVNGGMPTSYILNKSVYTSRRQVSSSLSSQLDVVEDIFCFVKILNPFIECVYDSPSTLMFSITACLPFRKINTEWLNFFHSSLKRIKPILNMIEQFNYNDRLAHMYITPLELKCTFISHIRKYMYTSLIGISGPEGLRKNFEYCAPSKMCTVSYYQNRFTSADIAEKYYSFTYENSHVYLVNIYNKKKPNEKIFDKEKATFNLKTVYSANPHFTADGNVLSDDIVVEAIIKQKCRFEFALLLPHDNLIWNTKLSSDNALPLHNAYGICVKKAILICTIERHHNKKWLQYKYFQQVKLTIVEVPLSHGWKYLVYKYVDEPDFLKQKFDMSIHASTPLNRKGEKYISISIVTTTRCNNYSGMKLNDQCGQKGLAIVQDTSRFQKIFNLPEKPDVVQSLFSAVGRVPLPQFRCMYAAQTDEERRNNDNIMMGNSEFVMLKNMSSAMCTKGKMRVDIGLCKILRIDNCNHTTFELQQTHNSNGQVLPPDIIKAMSSMCLYKGDLQLYDDYGNKDSIAKHSFLELDHLTTQNK